MSEKIEVRFLLPTVCSPRFCFLFQFLFFTNSNMSKSYRQLISAAGHGYVDKVAALIADHVDVNRGPVTALFYAARNGHLEIVKELLHAGANIEKGDVDYDVTPLYEACRGGHVEVVRELLRHGADAYINKEKITPLYAAARTGNHEIVKELLTAGAEVDKGTAYGDGSPLYVASRFGHLDVVKALIDAKADVHKKETYSYETPLSVAVKYAHTDVSNMLMTVC